MAERERGERPEILNDIASARRGAMLKFAIEQEQEKHYSEALDMYRQIIETYPDTAEEAEARERMLDLAYLFGSEKQSYRMLGLYGELEGMYARGRDETVAESRRARVKEILDEIHGQDRREAEAQTRLEAIREGRMPSPEPERTPREAIREGGQPSPGPARTAPEPKQQAARQQRG